jgi:hypothetical protein
MTLYHVIHNKDNPYLTINTTIVKDSRLSAKAKFYWLYAFSKPRDWQFYEADLVKSCTDNVTAVRTGLKELEKTGYLYRAPQKRDKKGIFENRSWYFFENCKTPNEIKEMFPLLGFPSTDESQTDKRTLVSNEEENIKESQSVGAPQEEEKITEEAKADSERSTFFECFKETPISIQEKFQLTKSYPDEERMRGAVTFATGNKDFNPVNLAAVITSNYKNNRKPSKCGDDVISQNKAFCGDFMPLMSKVLGEGRKSALEPLNGHLEFNHGGVDASPCWNWDLYDFIEKIRNYFTTRNLWNTELEELVLKYRC